MYESLYKYYYRAYSKKIILKFRNIFFLGFGKNIFYVKYYKKNSLKAKLVKVLVLALCLCSFYFTDVAYKAETMFREPETIQFANAADNVVPDKGKS